MKNMGKLKSKTEKKFGIFGFFLINILKAYNATEQAHPYNGA